MNSEIFSAGLGGLEASCVVFIFIFAGLYWRSNEDSGLGGRVGAANRDTTAQIGEN